MQKNSLTSKTAASMLVIGGGKIISALRAVIFAALFGATWQTDAFYLSINVVAMLSSFTMAFSTVIVPKYTGLLESGGKEAADRYISSLLNVTVLFALLLCVPLFFAVPAIVTLFAPFFDERTHSLSASMMRVTLPLLAVSGAYSVFTGVLNSRSQFARAQISGVAFNLAWLVITLLFARQWGINALLFGYGLGSAAQLFALMPGAGKFYRYTAAVDFAGVKESLLKVLPVFVALSVSVVNQMVDKALASGLEEGTISAINYSDQLVSQVGSAIIVPIMTTMLTALSLRVNAGDGEGAKRLFGRASSAVLLLLVPITVYSMLCGGEIIRAAFVRGAFNAEAHTLVSTALFYYAPYMIFWGPYALMQRFFYAYGDTKTSLLVSLTGIVLNIALDLMLVGPFGIAGLTAATSVSMAGCCAAGMLLARRRFGPMGFWATTKNAGRALLACAVMPAVILACKAVFKDTVWPFLLLSAALSFAAYFAALLLLRQDDALLLAGKLRRKTYK